MFYFFKILSTPYVHNLLSTYKTFAFYRLVTISTFGFRNFIFIKIIMIKYSLENERRSPDSNRDIPEETGSQGQRSTRLCHCGISKL